MKLSTQLNITTKYYSWYLLRTTLYCRISRESLSTCAQWPSCDETGLRNRDFANGINPIANYSVTRIYVAMKNLYLIINKFWSTINHAKKIHRLKSRKQLTNNSFSIEAWLNRMVSCHGCVFETFMIFFLLIAVHTQYALAFHIIFAIACSTI